jgi:16S rRNA processing protein RimM
MLQVAKVLKSHGTDGGLLLGFRGIDPEQIDITEPVFIYFDELPVPFFIQTLKRRGTDKAIVTLNDVTSLEDAEELVGQSVWVDWEEEEGDGEGLGDLVGWTLAGAGRITGFLDIPANPCLEVETKNGTSVLVPFHEDLILSADPDARVLEMEIPDGLFDL